MRPLPLRSGRVGHRRKFPYFGHHAKLGRSVSNQMGVQRGAPKMTDVADPEKADSSLCLTYHAEFYQVLSVMAQVYRVAGPN